LDGVNNRRVPHPTLFTNDVVRRQGDAYALRDEHDGEVAIIGIFER
jgi:hypothetical protein